MADVVLRATQPALAAIKLAWWRERLEELNEGKVPAEPRLQDAGRELLSRGITGASLAELEEGWAALLEEVPDVARVQQRGETLFRLGAALLKTELDEKIGAAGRLFALGDISRRGLRDLAVGTPDTRGLQIPRSARTLTALAALAARDLRRGPPLEAEATPGRAWTLLRHRLTGRL
jgi:15-cis-phytoene synthase